MGPFEIAVLDVENIRFMKFSDVLFTFWRIVYSVQQGRMVLRIIPKFLKYDYFQDCLIAQVFHCRVSGQYRLKLMRHEYRLYTPLIKRRDEYDLSGQRPPSFQHKILCCFTLWQHGQRLENGVQIFHASEGDTPLIVNFVDGKLHLALRKDLIQNLEAEASAATGMEVVFAEVGD